MSLPQVALTDYQSWQWNIYLFSNTSGGQKSKAEALSLVSGEGSHPYLLVHSFLSSHCFLLVSLPGKDNSSVGLRPVLMRLLSPNRSLIGPSIQM